MAFLFNRNFEIKVDQGNKPPLDLTGLHTRFSCEKTAESSPDIIEVEIFNLSKDNINKIQLYGDTISLSASYGKTELEVFASGDITSAKAAKSGVDRATKINAADGVIAYTESTFNGTSPKDDNGSVIINSLFSALTGQFVNRRKSKLHGKQLFLSSSIAYKLGLNLGLATSQLPGTITPEIPFSGYNRPTAVFGLTAENLNNICARFGLLWTIDNSMVDVFSVNGDNGDFPIEVNNSTGLIGEVELLDNGGCEFTTLLNPKLKPLVGVNVKSLNTMGKYRIIKAVISGDTNGNDWYTKCTCDNPYGLLEFPLFDNYGTA